MFFFSLTSYFIIKRNIYDICNAPLVRSCPISQKRKKEEEVFLLSPVAIRKELENH